MRNPITLLIAGIVPGTLSTIVLVLFLAPNLMVTEHASRFDVDQTVDTILAEAGTRGWMAPKAYKLQKTFEQSGYRDVVPMRVVSLCQPHHAHRILRTDVNRRVSAVMPCRIGVYKGSNGGTYIAQMNMPLMARIFGGEAGDVIGRVASDEDSILASVIAE